MKVHQIEPDRWAFECPGCGCGHFFDVSPGRWTWNGDLARPTVKPSILVTSNGRANDPDGKYGTYPPARCHSFVTDGNIQFLSDSTHELAGQTVMLPDWDEER